MVALIVALETLTINGSWISGQLKTNVVVVVFCCLGIAPRAKILKMSAWQLHPKR